MRGQHKAVAAAQPPPVVPRIHQNHIRVDDVIGRNRIFPREDISQIRLVRAMGRPGFALLGHGEIGQKGLHQPVAVEEMDRYVIDVDEETGADGEREEGPVNGVGR